MVEGRQISEIIDNKVTVYKNKWNILKYKKTPFVRLVML